LVTGIKNCALCGLPLPNPPIEREVQGQSYHFCCQGCARVYEVASENDLLEQVLPQFDQPTGSKIKELVRKPAESAFFSIEGMWCPGCSLAAERILRSQPGIRAVDISFSAERGRIEFDPAVADPQALLTQLNPLGYRAQISSSAKGKKEERIQERISLQLIAAVAFGMQVMMLYLVQLYPLYSLGQFDSRNVRQIQYVVWALATPVLFFGGLTFLRGAWRALLAKTATMDTLVSLGVLAAYGYSVYITLTGHGTTYFDSVTMITSFILFGRYLETVGGAQARKDLHGLLRLQPEFAWRQQAGKWEKIQARTLHIGDVIRIREGEQIPADGVILEGEGEVDEAMLTGEARLVKKAATEAVFAGTLLREGVLTASVSALPVQTRLSQINELVNETLSAKPPIQRLADRISTYFTFGILGIAILALGGWLAAGYPLERGILAAVAVLVVACPCALGLATPLALSVAISKAVGQGVLVRNPSALETAAKIQRVVFDKTGTLTSGDLTLLKVVPVPTCGLSEQSLWQLAASVEQFSSHPLAQAILKDSPPPLEAGEFIALRGAGASARVLTHPPRRVVVGSFHLVQVDPASALLPQAEQYAAQGKTVVWVRVEDEVSGFLVLQDKPQPAATLALHALRQRGIHLAILSGDSHLATEAVASALGIQDFEGSCLPEKKAEYIRRWQEKNQPTAMVGDGVNDAPALARADLSITPLGGSDIAGNTSDIILTRNDLNLVPWFLKYSQRTRHIILENLGWAFAYNLVAVPLAILGIISPAIAAAAMAASSILVVFNSLRLRKDG